MDCLSNDEVEKQFPIHIAYKSSHVMTLVEGTDGVARLITRDLIGNRLSLGLPDLPVGAHVWTAIPIEVLPVKPSAYNSSLWLPYSCIERSSRSIMSNALTVQRLSPIWYLQRRHFSRDHNLSKKIPSVRSQVKSSQLI